MQTLTLFAQATSKSSDSSASIAVGIIIAVIGIVALWRVFQKAGRPGWAAIIPLYNVYIMLKMAGRPGWWLILYLIPIIGLIVHIVVSIDLAKAFGKSGAFGFFGLWLFSIIGYLVLAFGDAKYKGAPQHS